MRLGEFIKNYRTENNLSIRAFATMCHISPGYISMLEKGIQPTTGRPITASTETIKKLVTGMSISYYELFTAIDRSDIVTFNDHDYTISSIDEECLFEVFRSLEASKKAELYRIIMDYYR